MFVCLELLLICGLHCVATYPDPKDPKKEIKRPNIMDYEWVSDVDVGTLETCSAKDFYLRDTKACFKHFFEAIAQPQFDYWSSSTLGNWPEQMDEMPWIARDGWLYRGCREDPKDDETGEFFDIELMKSLTGFRENLFARAVMKYADGAEYVIGQTVHCSFHRQTPRQDPRFEETRKTIEWTILAIFVSDGTNKIDKNTGPVFLVYSEPGTHFRKEREMVGGKWTDLDGVPDTYGFDWPKP